MPGNASLNRAQAAENNDEFYTRREDIENELHHYRGHFKDKVVLINCNDLDSEFRKHCDRYFDHYGLKGLIATGWEGGKPKVYRRMAGDAEGTLSSIGSARFESPECVALLLEADIVVGNPPFSQFRDFLGLLIKNEKEFLVMADLNALTYKETFPLFMDGRLWHGVTTTGQDIRFRVPDPSTLTPTSRWVDPQTGVVHFRSGRIRWLTNLDHAARHEPIKLWKTYSPEVYPKYDNFDAIEVSAWKDIPCDYYGVMGLPITGLWRVCPEQFEIVGIAGIKGQSGGTWIGGDIRPKVHGTTKHMRVLIRRKQ